jgi:hypothetical protein
MLTAIMKSTRFPPFKGTWWRNVKETESRTAIILEHIYAELARCDFISHFSTRPVDAVRSCERDQFEALCFAHNLDVIWL